MGKGLRTSQPIEGKQQVIKQNQVQLATKLQKIETRTLSNSRCTFNWLTPLLSAQNLKICFHELDGKKAVGTDGVTKAEYGKNLSENLTNLVERMKANKYRPRPMRLVEIPKNDGTSRPISIACVEDKVVETLLAKIIGSIYEPSFVDFSFGFRPGRNPHMAIRSLYDTLAKSSNAHVVDIDLADFYGSIEHDKLLQVLRMRIKDETFLRLLSRFLKNGYAKDGETGRIGRGVPQGSILGPVIANVYAHYCIDRWCEREFGATIQTVRFADDFVVVTTSEEQAKAFLDKLKHRLEHCGLRLNEDKSKVVKFSKEELSKGIQQGVFCFLGFQFYLGKSRRGNTIPRLQTDPKRLRKKLESIKDWCTKTSRRHKLLEFWPTICAKLQGHINYFGVSLNLRRLASFIFLSTRIVFKILNRRSQRKSFTWEKFNLFLARNGCPKARITYSLW